MLLLFFVIYYFLLFIIFFLLLIAVGDELEYSASLLDMPDLPHWMFCNHPANKSEAYLYGSAEEPGDIQIEVRSSNFILRKYFNHYYICYV